MGRFVDLTGQRFGMLTVICRNGTSSDKQALWECKCDCGKVHFVRGRDLRSGHTKTCGCKSHELTNAAKITHGQSDSRVYGIWRAMRSRCYLPSVKEYKNYGGRGITVCDEWRNDFQAFYDWAMANGYAEDLTIERKDVNGNYEPSNCRWVTNKEQQNNKRNNHLLEYNGEIHTITEWSEITGIKKTTIERRINKYGWSIEKSLTKKPRHDK